MVTVTGKEIMFSVALVCLFVCLVSNITQKVLNGLQEGFMEGSRVVKGTSD